MTATQSLERVERESARTALAQRALATRAAPLSRLAGRVHPLVLTGSALAAGLLAGRLFGRPRLPRALEPATLVSSALQRALVGLLEALFSAALTREPASAGSTADSPPETQSRAP